jgi:glyoxylase-like metal-dependent hydrolase (beta-lactamase superfamily II)
MKHRPVNQDSARPLIDYLASDIPPEFQSILKKACADVKHLYVTLYHQDHAGLAGEMNQKGVVLVVNGKPAILYPEAALENEAGRILLRNRS